MTPGRPISDEMAHRCSLLAAEILTWPDVSGRSMFGYRAFYRGAVIFAMFPEKRMLESPTAIAYKVYDRRPNAPRPNREGPNWHVFELNDDRSVARAIATLEKAYSSAILKTLNAYSERSACMTSTRAARAAGNTDAITAAAIRTTPDPITGKASGCRTSEK